MNNKIQPLVDAVATSRAQFIELTRQLTEQQAQWKPSPEEWSVVDVTEHLFWAEQGAIVGMWKFLHAIRAGEKPRQLESEHQDLPVETIIEQTWQEKEQVPAIAAPRFGGPIAFWRVSLESLQPLLQKLADDMEEQDLRTQAHPHPISGAMDFQQRFEFLRFHIDRHIGQIERLRVLLGI
ncbi:MAG: DinB family protein [Saprospiraceae bacterium]|nr:DinB family protein [Saprospiraceae bacterium]